MESISARAVATATDLILKSGGGSSGLQLLSTGTETEPSGYSSLLASRIYAIFRAICVWIMQAVYCIISNPFLLMMTGFAVLGLAIGVFGYLIRRD